MQRSSILGLPVILAPTGRRLGQVLDLALLPAAAGDGAAHVAGVLVSGGWGRLLRLLDRQAVAGWGPDAVLAAGECWLETAAALPAARLCGKPVLAVPGRELGELDDLAFDPDSGALTGFALSAGLVADLLHGKALLSGPLRLGESVLWAPPPLQGG